MSSHRVGPMRRAIINGTILDSTRQLIDILDDTMRQVDVRDLDDLQRQAYTELAHAKKSLFLAKQRLTDNAATFPEYI